MQSRGGGTADALRSGRSVLTGRVGSNPSLGTKLALVAQLDRAQGCGLWGRGFESLQARHKGDWLSWLERLVYTEEVGGSSPSSPTIVF